MADTPTPDSTDTSETGNPQNRDEQGRFPPGVSGNPGGRPKGVSLAATIAATLTPEDAAAIVKTAVAAAIAGDERYFRALIERTDGKVTDKIEHSGELTLSMQTLDAIKQRADADN